MLAILHVFPQKISVEYTAPNTSFPQVLYLPQFWGFYLARNHSSLLFLIEQQCTLLDFRISDQNLIETFHSLITEILPLATVTKVAGKHNTIPTP